MPKPDDATESQRSAMQMRASSIALALLLPALAVEAGDGVAFLQTLAKQLNEARALPAGSNYSYHCPSIGKLDEVIGMSQDTVESILPKPDGDLMKSEKSYFVTSPYPADRRGGGFAEITIRYDKSGIVKDATCNYSR